MKRNSVSRVVSLTREDYFGAIIFLVMFFFYFYLSVVCHSVSLSGLLLILGLPILFFSFFVLLLLLSLLHAEFVFIVSIFMKPFFLIKHPSPLTPFQSRAGLVQDAMGRWVKPKFAKQREAAPAPQSKKGEEEEKEEEEEEEVGDEEGDEQAGKGGGGGQGESLEKQRGEGKAAKDPKDKDR